MALNVDKGVPNTVCPCPWWPPTRLNEIIEQNLIFVGGRWVPIYILTLRWNALTSVRILWQKMTPRYHLRTVNPFVNPSVGPFVSPSVSTSVNTLVSTVSSFVRIVSTFVRTVSHPLAHPLAPLAISHAEGHGFEPREGRGCFCFAKEYYKIP